MPRTVKIAISLPEDLFRAAEGARAKRGETRSGFIRALIEDHIHTAREREWDRQYAEAYQRKPDTPEEMAVAEASARYGALEHPWEDE